MQIIKINQETQRISLGMKQLQTDPWEGVGAKYPVGARFKGKVTNVTDYGAFVELEPGVEGLVHVSEMSWVKKNVAPEQDRHAGPGSRSEVLEVDSNKRRISLGLKQMQENPWNAFTAQPSVGHGASRARSVNITEFGLFIGLDGDIDGMVHLSDLSWDKQGEEAIKNFAKGQSVKVKVLDIDVEKERVSLGIKQLDAIRSRRRPVGGALKKGDVVTGHGHRSAMTAASRWNWKAAASLIRRADLARDRNDQRPERFGEGDKIDALVTIGRQDQPQGRPLDQGARSRRREGSRRAIRLLRLGRRAWATSSARPSRRRRRRRTTKRSTTAFRKETPGAVGPGVFFLSYPNSTSALWIVTQRPQAIGMPTASQASATVSPARDGPRLRCSMMR